MNDDEILLNHIYQNAEMGLNSIPHLLSKIDDPDFKTAVKTQYQEYEKILNHAKEKMKEANIKPEEAPEIAKIWSGIMTELKTLSNDSTSHMAEMMILGSTMGTTKVLRQMRVSDNASGDIILLAKKLLETEEANISEMKKFL